MYGFTLKKAAITLALLTTSSFALAIPESSDTHDTQKVYGKAGCMMCHQGDSAQSDNDTIKNDNESTAKQTT